MRYFLRLSMRCAFVWLAIFGHGSAACFAEGALDGYENYAQFVKHIEQLDDASPCVRVESLAKTGPKGQKEVWLVTVGHPDARQASENRAVLVLGSVEPNRPLGSELSVRLIERLVQSSEGKKDGGPILSQTTFYIIPRPAPDAHEAFFQKPYRERTGNLRPIDDDHDGHFDEDEPDDLNGDGWITMMRVEDPCGKFIPHPDDPRVMIEADPEAKEKESVRYRLYTEGRDDDHDELFNEDTRDGVVFNRNFPFDYDYFGKGVGRHQVSEPETRAVADFAFSRPNIAAVFSFSANDNLMQPWRPDRKKERDQVKTAILTTDVPYLDQLAAKYQKIHGGKDAPAPTVEKGSFASWAYFHLGRPSLTVRGWWVPQVSPVACDRIPVAGDGVDDTFVPWTKVDHPDFQGRTVEVGGFKPFVQTTPPGEELDRLAEIHGQFLEELVDSLARIEIGNIEVESGKIGIYHVTATITNKGKFPTELRMGTLSRRTYPIQAELLAPQETIFLKGSRRTRIKALALGESAKVEWIAKVPSFVTKLAGQEPQRRTPEFQVHAWSPSVGSAWSGGDKKPDITEKHTVTEKPIVVEKPAVIEKPIVAKNAVKAGKSTPYEAMGTPSEPKVDVRWNQYHDHAEITRVLKGLAKSYPEYARLKSLGKSYGGREMWVMTITNFAKGKESEKPAFMVTGGIHANEIQNSDAALYIAWYLLEMKDRVPFLAKLIGDRTFYIIPAMSPDARDSHLHEPNSRQTPRSGCRPIDDDRDGLVDEDGFDDLDGDGHICQMRVPDPKGDYKQHPDFPNLMVPCKKGEKGSYRVVGSEGIDNDGDGLVNEDKPGDYDPNRDWPNFWQPSYVNGGSHYYPLSVPENRLVADFVISHPNIASAQSFHNTGGMILSGPFAPDERYERSDMALYHALAEKGSLILPGYREMVCGEKLYGIYGEQTNWMHAMQGIFTFSIEMFAHINYFHSKRGEPVQGYTKHAEIEQIFNQYLLFDQATIPWRKFKHPQYGTVEIGGLKKSIGRQPPGFMLEEECHRVMAFACYHAGQMPSVKIELVEVKELNDGVKQVTATIANGGLLPTHSAQDLKYKISTPDRVSIRSADKNMKVSLGLYASEPSFGEPTVQRRNPAEIRVENLPGKSKTYVRWYVTGEGPFEIELISVKGGRDKRTP